VKRSQIALLVLGVLAIAEIVLLSAVGRAIGAVPLLLILIGEAVIGGWLVRHEGAKAWASLRDAQRDPARQGATLSDAGLILAGALLLILPGFISDAVGLLFLIPATRGLARQGVTALFASLTRGYRDQIDLMAARTDPGSVVEGQVAETPHRPAETPNPPDDEGDGPLVIRGEIEP